MLSNTATPIYYGEFRNSVLRGEIPINKEIEMQFVLGYTPLEFRDALHMIAEGKIDCTPLITGIVGLDGVINAFSALRDPESHAKILVDPKKVGSEISKK